MSITVIYTFKVIDIQNHQTDALTSCDQLLQLFVEIGTVVDTGQRIVYREHGGIFVHQEDVIEQHDDHKEGADHLNAATQIPDGEIVLIQVQQNQIAEEARDAECRNAHPQQVPELSDDNCQQQRHKPACHNQRAVVTAPGVTVVTVRFINQIQRDLRIVAGQVVGKYRQKENRECQ